MAEYNIQYGGSTYNVKADTDEQAQTAIDDLLGQLQPGKLESFGRAAINNLPFGGQIGALGTSALKDEGYSQALAEWNAKAKEAKEVNPISYGAGAFTGAVAPLAIPGVGGAMTAAPITTGAALGAAGAVGNIDIAQQPGEALKQAALGAGIGGVTSGLLGRIGPKAENLENYASKEAFKSFELNPKMAGKLAPEEVITQGAMARKQGLMSGNLEARLANVSGLKQQVGDQIGALKAFDAPVGDLTEFIEPLHEKMQQAATVYGPTETAEAGVYKQGIDNLNRAQTYGELQNLKTEYGRRAFDATHQVKSTPGAQALADVHSSIKDAMKAIAKNSQHEDILHQYTVLGDMEMGIEKQLGTERAVSGGGMGVGGHGLHSIIRQVPGISNPKTAVPIGAAAAAMGHPVLGGAMALHSLLNEPAKRASLAGGLAKAQPYLAGGIKAVGIDAMVTNLLQNPQSYGRYSAPLMKAMQSGGKQGFAATSFVLRQQHPDLNDMMLQQGQE